MSAGCPACRKTNSLNLRSTNIGIRRSPHIKRCLWSNEQLSTKADKKCWFGVRNGCWSFFQRQGLELCYVEVEARQWKDQDQDHPECAHDGSDLITVDLTIIFFDGGRTERAKLSICGGTKSWLPNELAVAASFFLSVEQDEDDDKGGS